MRLDDLCWEGHPDLTDAKCRTLPPKNAECLALAIFVHLGSAFATVLREAARLLTGSLKFKCMAIPVMIAD